MQSRLSRAASARMRGDIEAAIEYLPGLASLALWCEFADTNDDVVAYTDGSTIYAGERYEKREPKARRFICLHEILHVALCHPQRFVELKKRDATFNPKLLNIAADAIINGSLENLTGIETPSDAWTLQGIWHALEASGAAESGSRSTVSSGYSFVASQPPKKIANLTRSEFTTLNRWSCEELYYFLKAQTEIRPGFFEILVEGYGKDSLGCDLRESGGEKAATKRVERNGSNGGNASEEKREWHARLSVLRGALPELFERLAGELPVVETPWEQVLRNVLQTAFQERTIRDYSRPSRRWLALERNYQQTAGVALPFAPNARKKPGARLAVALDTSGSIDAALLDKFLAEIVALCELNQRDLVLIVGDAKVHGIAEIEWTDAARRLSEIKYTGGGGTDFRPLIAAAASHCPDALVYLTDLYGETGDAPGFPVVWACAPETSAIAPWGEQIKLK